MLLADLALDADQGVLHHAPDVVPGLPELVEAHRAGSLSASAIHSMVFDVHERGYHLLLGLRRRRGWASLRPRLEAALDSLLAAYPIVVGDVDPDVDGHHECGSFEVEERNALSRAAPARAEATVVVGSATIGGLHGLAEVLDDLCEHGLDPGRIVPVVNHSPRSPRERAAIARLADARRSTAFRGEPRPRRARVRPCSPRGRRRGERWTCASDSAVTPVTRAVAGLLEDRELVLDLTESPMRVAPGSLGHWSETEAADAV